MRAHRPSSSRSSRRHLLLSAVCLPLVGGARAQTPAEPARRVNLALGSVAASSGVYAFSAALAAAARRHDPALGVTTVEGGGGFDHARLMKNRVLDFSISGSPAIADAVLSGTGGFQREGAWPAIRLMFMRNVNVARIYVRADAAERARIRGFSDLARQRVAPGVPGTRDLVRVTEANASFGVGMLMTPGSLEDSANQLRAGRVVAMVKGSPHDRFDPAMLAIHFGAPLTVIGFAPDQAERLRALDPMNTFVVTPRGGIRELPEVGPVLEMSSSVMVMASTNMPQDIGYRLARAAAAGWAEIAEAFAPSAGLDPIADAFAQTPERPGLHFHAGVIQFARERGVAVPAHLIPPEFAPAR